MFPRLSKSFYREFGNGIESLRALYQKNGHVYANINPLEPKSHNNLLSNIKIDFKDPVTIGHKKVENSTDLKNIFNQIYCSSCGFEISHISSQLEVEFLTTKIESFMTLQLSEDTKKGLGKLLLETEGFDLFMNKRFGNVKRYGLEGLEASSIILDFILKTALGIDHVIVTMPHRGRLNLMTLLMKYPAEAIFHKLAGNSELPKVMKGSSGDVLSHLSFQKRIEIAGNENGMITLLPNPSHLEAVNAVGMGVVYAYQNYVNPEKETLSVQFHGDAAFVGQGVVAECLQLSGLPNFSVKGTIHVICNNQLGFTTETKYGRTSKYASDPAKAIDAPIFHVNADDPEATAKVTCIAVEYQKAFKKDVVIDLIGWRKMGHNELDEPSFTQPKMYEAIRNRSSTAQKYSQGVLNIEGIKDIEKESFEKLDQAVQKSKDYEAKLIGIQNDWRSIKSETGVKKEILKSVALESIRLPVQFKIHPRLQKHHIEHRIKQLEEDRIDWSTAEAMAIGSLLREGFNVRISGQDVARGTFSQRHLRFHDQITGEYYEPFNLNEPKLELAMSNLSEFGVLGFEYGLSIASGNKLLPIWEAQFGDFFNGAQVIFDAFLSSGEEKWGLSSNLTVLLPHGYDGAGPEHSSARIERFLQNCDDKGNWRVVNPTTPSNYFHLLRSQIKNEVKKPLIIISPKTLLKSPKAVSSLEDFTKSFQPIIIDHNSNNAKKVLVLVSGKFYYDLKKEFHDTFKTVIRIEQLNPFPEEELKSIKIQEYHKIIWCQEEPKNQGAYSFIVPKLEKMFKYSGRIEYIGRRESAAPATGVKKQHEKEIEEIFNAMRLI